MTSSTAMPRVGADQRDVLGAGPELLQPAFEQVEWDEDQQRLHHPFGQRPHLPGRAYGLLQQHRNQHGCHCDTDRAPSAYGSIRDRPHVRVAFTVNYARAMYFGCFFC